MQNKVIGFCMTKIRNEDHWLRLKAFQESASEKGYGLLTYYLDDGDIGEAEEETGFTEVLSILDGQYLKALLIDAEGMTAQDALDKLAGQAVQFGIPVFVWNGSAKGAVSLDFVKQYAVERLLQHLTGQPGLDSMIYVSDKKSPGLTGQYFFDYFISRGIPREQLLHLSKHQVKVAIEELPKEELPDAFVCENDDVAHYVNGQMFRKGYQPGREALVFCVGGGAHAKIRGLNFSACVIDYSYFMEKIIELLETKTQDAGEETLKNLFLTKSLLRLRKVEYSTYDAELTTHFLYKNLSDSMAHEQSLYGLTDLLLNTDGIENIAEVLSSYMLQNSVFCVKDSFMQDIFVEGIKEYPPKKGDKYFILTDTREHPMQWASFLLGETIPGLEEGLEKNIPIIITPVHYLHQNFGYLIFFGQDYDYEYYKMDRVVHNFGRVLARYTVEKRLTFVNSMLVNANENVRKLQHGDILTGLLNAEGFHHELNKLISYCKNNHEELMIGCLDIDRLSNINDIYGHSEGDHAIKAVAQLIQQCVTEKMICARLGTDEFVIAGHSMADVEDIIRNFIDQMAQQLNEYNRISGKEYTIELNYGYLSVKPENLPEEREILDEVFSKKNVQKNSKRATLHKADREKDTDYSKEDHERVMDIMDRNLFLYAFQPIVSARTGEIYAYEALMRSPVEKPVSPLTILKYATLEKRLYNIEYATLNNVFKLVSKNKEILNGKKIFVNSIPGYFLEEDDFEKLKHKYSDIFDNVVIEVTEQTESDDGCIGVLMGRSDANGFELAIDDFGTGYSNTVNLLKYLPNYVKIDRMLISDINQEPKKQHFVKNIIEFAHDNGFMALAEGVETIEELKALIRMDIDLIQGFYTARPEFEIVSEIRDSCRQEIVQANMERYETLRKRVYLAANEPELNLMHLALQKYTGLVVAESEIKLVGNPDFVAGINIKIKENTHCRMTVSDLRLRSTDGAPCIDVGENAVLTLVVEGENELLEGGIRVPENARLILEGSGNLTIRSKKSNFYGIGNDNNSSFGLIESNMSGALQIISNSSVGIGIGGGICKKGCGILIHSGKIVLEMSAINGVGVGALEGEIPIELFECNFSANLSFTEGTGIGSVNGVQNFNANNVTIDIHGTGNEFAGIGTIHQGRGCIEIQNAAVYMNICGRRCFLIGTYGGELKVITKWAKLQLSAEGRECLGLGTYQKDAIAELEGVTLEQVLRTNDPVFLGFSEAFSTKEAVTELFTME